MRDRIFVVLIALAVLVTDQVTKMIVNGQIALHERIPIIDNFLALTHVRNRGAAFGLFANVSPGILRTSLIIVSVAAVGLIWAYAREGWHEPRIMVAFGAILGGAVGNLVDRMRLGYVVDYIDVHWGPYHWPSFNVADAAITIGALTLFIAMARQGSAAEEPLLVAPEAQPDAELAPRERSAEDQPGGPG